MYVLDKNKNNNKSVASLAVCNRQTEKIVVVKIDLS